MQKRMALRVIEVVGALVVIGALGLYFVARGDTAKLPEIAAMGPSPTLPEPTKTLIPTVHIAPAKGWSEGGKPTPASGFEVDAFATGLDHPRWLYVLPNGDVLVAQALPRPWTQPTPPCPVPSHTSCSARNAALPHLDRLQWSPKEAPPCGGACNGAGHGST